MLLGKFCFDTRRRTTRSETNNLLDFLSGTVTTTRVDRKKGSVGDACSTVLIPKRSQVDNG